MEFQGEKTMLLWCFYNFKNCKKCYCLHWYY